MAYSKQTWENLPSQNTPITAERLNHMEDGIYENSTDNNNIAEMINNFYEAVGLKDDTYNSSSTYNTDDLVIKNYGIYEANEDNITGTWNPTKWTLVPISEADSNSIKINNKLNKDIYSTSEIKTNKIWVDNKPIYKKTFINTNIALSTSGTTLGTIQNIDTWTGSDYRISAPNSKNSGRTGYLNSSYYSGIQVSTNGTVSVYGHDGQNNVYAQVTIEYTKTTD